LQRDRNLINEFDIFMATSHCWKNLPDAVGHSRNGYRDVHYLDSWSMRHTNNEDDTHKENNNKAHTMFISEYGSNANPVVYESDKIEGAKNVIVESTYKALIVSSDNFNKPTPVIKKIEMTPYEILKEYSEEELEGWDAYDERFLEILEMSKNWVVKEGHNSDIPF